MVQAREVIMPFRRTIATSLSKQSSSSSSCGCGGPITLAYQRLVSSGKLRIDNQQLSLSTSLDTLYTSLASTRSERFLIPDEHVEIAATYYAQSSSSSSTLASIISNNFVGFAKVTAYSILSSSITTSSPRGIYVHGSVGVGKSLLMDLFYSICSKGYHNIPKEEEDDDDEKNTNNNNILYHPISRRCKRLHFNEFMLNVHQRIHTYKVQFPKGDAIPYVAASLAIEARLLCFDEMQVTDIADAMIIKRLFTILLDLGVIIVTTSNRPPSGLYEGGINRSVFLPFIDTLQERMDVIEMDGSHDYRRDSMLDDTIATSSDASSSTSTCSLPTMVCSSNPSSPDILEQWFAKGGDGESKGETIPVVMGRKIHVTRANNTCGRFTFNELCKQPLGAADYIAIANRFDMIIVENVPQLGGHIYNEARRFVTLIDALYEARTKLIISTIEDIEIDELFVGFDATVETNDGDEEIAIGDNSNTTNNKESAIIGEGGSSSSSSTTIIHTKIDGKVEWSATGRIGVSLAQLSAVKEVSYSFKRASSRIAEMSYTKWGR